MLHPLEFAALLSAARTSSPNDHALVCLLGMLGLRVSEACGADITDIRYESGYELLHVIGKGAKPADIPLPIPVLRAVREAIGGRASGPILRTRTDRRMDRAGASRALTRVARGTVSDVGFGADGRHLDDCPDCQALYPDDGCRNPHLARRVLPGIHGGAIRSV